MKSNRDMRIALLRQEFVDELIMERSLKDEFLSVFKEVRFELLIALKEEWPTVLCFHPGLVRTLLSPDVALVGAGASHPDQAVGPGEGARGLHQRPGCESTRPPTRNLAPSCVADVVCCCAEDG